MLLLKTVHFAYPTAFCSYGGHALDKKTPLLRSMEAINRQAMRVLKLFGNEGVHSVKTTVGPEQEYFLVDKDLFDRRKDLIFTGRTLFGAKPPKGQELEDHYFGSIKPRVSAFMKDLNEELWKLGILAKTEHNEVAPAQHELAPIFTTTNIATDHNQLTMEIMQNVAKKHNMVCLLHEKPFAGVNGSGKHNNWSISTDTGMNLLEPGETPAENAQFLLFLCAVIKAVDEYQDLLRISAASAGNDHRLGANEAPPAVVSMFLGDELTAVLQAIEKGEHYGAKEKELFKVGVHVLPRFPKDSTDRNRTSPFAFTGNKFEFRMPGSAQSVAGINTTLNTAVAEELKQFADELEGAKDFDNKLDLLIKKVIKEHKKIVFNGNGYDDAWIAEAEKRGLLNLKSTPEAVPYFIHKKNIDLFTTHNVLTEEEMKSRYEIMLENYGKIINIEALTMIDMTRKDILPAVSAYSNELACAIGAKKSVMASVDCTYEEETVEKISTLTTAVYKKVNDLENALIKTDDYSDSAELSMYYKTGIFSLMTELRISVDELETITSAEYWPYPSYGELIFGVR
jgi:glutamine synthetase